MKVECTPATDTSVSVCSSEYSRSNCKSNSEPDAACNKCCHSYFDTGTEAVIGTNDNESLQVTRDARMSKEVHECFMVEVVMCEMQTEAFEIDQAWQGAEEAPKDSDRWECDTAAIEVSDGEGREMQEDVSVHHLWLPL